MMRTGLFYKHIVKSPAVSDMDRVVFEAWLDSAVEEFPCPEDYGTREAAEYGSDVNYWFDRWFGNIIVEEEQS